MRHCNLIKYKSQPRDLRNYLFLKVKAQKNCRTSGSAKKVKNIISARQLLPTPITLS